MYNNDDDDGHTIFKRASKDFADKAKKATIKVSGKLKFKDWVDRYEVNISHLADNIGCSRQHLHSILKGRTTCSLPIALSIFYWSGGIVSMFSLCKDGDALASDLAEVIKHTHSLNRTRLKRKNQLVRYNLRQL